MTLSRDHFLQVGTGAVNRTVDDKLLDTVSVMDFGATGDGVTDDTSAIQAAIDSGYNIIIPAGKYITSSELVMDTSGQSFVGAGGNGDLSTTAITEIECSATSGSVLRFRKRSTTIKGLRLSSSAARFAATTTTGHGLHGEAADTVLTSMSRPVIHDLFIFEQPTDGCHIVGGWESGVLSLITVQDAVRHGYVFDDGTTGGRTNKDIAPFNVTADNCRAFECGGNAILVGASGETSVTRLFTFNKFEALGCAWDSAQRLSLYQVIDRGTQIEWNMLDCEDQQYANTTTSAGNTRTGLATPSKGVDSYRDLTVLNQPYFSSILESINVNSGSDGTVVLDPVIITGTYGVAQANAIIISNTSTGFFGRFLSGTTTGATDLIQNQALDTKYSIDGDNYIGANSTTFDIKDNTQPETGTIATGTLDTTSRLISLVGEGDVADTLSRIRHISGLNAIEGEKLTLIFGGGSSYTITILDVSGGGTNIRTRDAASISMTDTTRSIVHFVANASLEWVEV